MPFPGRDELRQQLEGAFAQTQGKFGCFTKLFPRRGPKASVTNFLPVAGSAGREYDHVEFLLFVRDGYLEKLEFVEYARDCGGPWPAPEEIRVTPQEPRTK